VGKQQAFGLPAELVAVLLSDPFVQFDVARKITSMLCHPTSAALSVVCRVR